MPKINRKRLYAEELSAVKQTLARLEKKIRYTDSSSSSEAELESDTSSSLSEQNCRGVSPAISTVHKEIDGSGEGRDNISNILHLFKDHPSSSETRGPDIHEELVVRWSAYLKSGINAETRKGLIEKYGIPENCKTLGIPLLNEEVKSILSSQSLKNDHFLSGIQGQLGASLSVLGAILSKKLNQPDVEISLSNDMIESLVDAGQLLTNIHHAISLKRKFEISPFLNEDSRSAANKNQTDEFLFGKDFLSKLKSCQEVKKAADEIKKRENKPTLQAAGTSGIQNLNYRRPFQKTKMKEGKRGYKEGSQRRRSKQHDTWKGHKKQEKTHPYDYRRRTHYRP